MPTAVMEPLLTKVPPVVAASVVPATTLPVALASMDCGIMRRSMVGMAATGKMGMEVTVEMGPGMRMVPMARMPNRRRETENPLIRQPMLTQTSQR